MARGGTDTDGARPLALAQDRYEAGALVIVAGIPGSGKSTYARDQFPDALIVNPDALRGSLINSAGEWDQTVSAAAFHRARGMIKEGMQVGLRPVVFDATNVHGAELTKLVTLARTLRPSRQVHLIMVEAPLDLARARNMERGASDPMRQVPDSVIEHFDARMRELACHPVLTSFDSVERVDAATLPAPTPRPARPAPRAHAVARLDQALGCSDAPAQIRAMAQSGELTELLPEVAATIGFDQRSAYHELPLFDHLLATLEAAIALEASLDVRWAALMHDVGKVASAWECSRPHATTPNAPMPHQHFYARYDRDLHTFVTEDHQVVGARQTEAALLDMGMEGARVRRIVMMDRLHMDKGAESLPRAIKLLAKGGELTEELLVLHAADRAGHEPSPKSFATARALLASELAMIARARSGETGAQQAASGRERLAVQGRDLHRAVGLAGEQIAAMVEHLKAEVAAGTLANDSGVLLARSHQLADQVRAAVKPSGKRR